MITAEGIWVSAAGRWVLQGVSLSVGRGEIGAVTGANGSGKSLLARALAGTLPVSRGRVRVDGGKVGYLPQLGGLYDYLTVIENLHFAASVASVPWRARRKVCGDLLELVGLNGSGHVDVARLTPGQRQRLCLARTLAGDPGVLVLDEPLTGLDSEGQGEIRHLLAELAGMGKTILVLAASLDGVPAGRTWTLKGGEVA
ncbi:MAG TPA: ABC transporter ATP-binding protein [Symbiobacteriaceae bacterium]|nr:ABC transporter ATP-binding protein [Symbiobacteriaceae bacterium]